jgi:uncharacterized protein
MTAEPETPRPAASVGSPHAVPGSAVPDELLAILRCSRCKGHLRLTFSALVHALECPGCALRFAIRDGIPIMLLDQATPI